MLRSQNVVLNLGKFHCALDAENITDITIVMISNLLKYLRANSLYCIFTDKSAFYNVFKSSNKKTNLF